MNANTLVQTENLAMLFFGGNQYNYIYALNGTPVELCLGLSPDEKIWNYLVRVNLVPMNGGRVPTEKLPKPAQAAEQIAAAIKLGEWAKANGLYSG